MTIPSGGHRQLWMVCVDKCSSQLLLPKSTTNRPGKLVGCYAKQLVSGRPHATRGTYAGPFKAGAVLLAPKPPGGQREVGNAKSGDFACLRHLSSGSTQHITIGLLFVRMRINQIKFVGHVFLFFCVALAERHACPLQLTSISGPLTMHSGACGLGLVGDQIDLSSRNTSANKTEQDCLLNGRRAWSLPSCLISEDPANRCRTDV